MWMLSSGALREKLNNPGYYKAIVDFPTGIPSPYENQIEMDLNRTFPTDPFFKEVNTINALRNILLAYSRRNISIGYCQGFNFIVGRIFKITRNEENTFWIFVQIIESILPLSYYSELSGIIVDTSILHILLKMYHQDLYDYLVALNYDLSINNILYKWFVSLFIQNINENLSYIVWDSLFLEGSIVLFKASLSMFRLMKYDIMQTKTVEDLHVFFDENICKYSDVDIMYWYCSIKIFEFGYSFINLHRLEYLVPVSETIVNGNKKRLEMLKSQKRQASYVKGMVVCQRYWPMCIYDLDYKYNNIISYLVLRTGENIRFIENYYFEECKKKPFRSKSYDKIAFVSNSKCRIYLNKNEINNYNNNLANKNKNKIDNQYIFINNNNVDNNLIYKNTDSNNKEKKAIFNFNIFNIFKNKNSNNSNKLKKIKSNEVITDRNILNSNIEKNKYFVSDNNLININQRNSCINKNKFKTTENINFNRTLSNINYSNNTNNNIEEKINNKSRRYTEDSGINKIKHISNNKKNYANDYDLTEEDIKQSIEEFNSSLKKTKKCLENNKNYSNSNSFEINKNNSMYAKNNALELTKERHSIHEEFLKVKKDNSRYISKSPKKINWRNNYDIMKFKSYSNLLIERREHICDEDMNEEEDDVIKKIQKEETIKNRATTIVHGIKQFVKGDNEKESYVKTMNFITSESVKKNVMLFNDINSNDLLKDHDIDI